VLQRNGETDYRKHLVTRQLSYSSVIRQLSYSTRARYTEKYKGTI